MFLNMFSEGFRGICGRRCMFRFLMIVLMSYACIHVYVLCLICCLGLLDSFGPL